MAQSTERASQATIDATVIDSELVDENLLKRRKGQNQKTKEKN
jgi:hypothetical protein